MIALDVVKSFFRRGVSPDDLRTQIKSLEKEKRELRYDQRRLEKQRIEAFERTKRARKRADNAEVMYHLQELKGLDTENRLLLKDLGGLNKTLIVLGHYKRRLERAEKGRNSTQVATLIERFRNSPSLAGIEETDINEEMLDEMLNEELSDIDRALGLSEDAAMDDRSRELLDAVDAMIEAERSGDDEAAEQVRRRLELVDDLDEEEEKAPAREEAPQYETEAAGDAGGAGNETSKKDEKN